MAVYLGIEIGGTKLQLGVGSAESTELDELVRADVVAAAGAEGILAQIRSLGAQLLASHDVARVGVGFGGPVDARTGRVTKSHQIAGWEDVPLADRLQEALGRPTVVDNDCNVAALAEAGRGAGREAERVFYVTVGTGIGGGFVVDGRLQGSQRPAIAEIGHLRPGTNARAAGQTVESIASGRGIEQQVRDAVRQTPASAAAREIEISCQGNLSELSTQQIAAAAEQGNELARQALGVAEQTLGWAIAQVVTLLAPNMVVVGGGVSLIGERFFRGLREQAATYVFPPLADAYTIVPAELGEEVVVQGALLLARGEI